jgi:hypothetical protein
VKGSDGYEIMVWGWASGSAEGADVEDGTLKSPSRTIFDHFIGRR